MCRRIEERLAWNLPDELFSQLSWSTGSGIQETRKSRSSPLISVRRTLHFGTLSPPLALPPSLSLLLSRSLFFSLSFPRRASFSSSQPLASPSRATFSPTLAPRRRYFSVKNGAADAREDLGNFQVDRETIIIFWVMRGMQRIGAHEKLTFDAVTSERDGCLFFLRSSQVRDISSFGWTFSQHVVRENDFKRSSLI